MFKVENTSNSRIIKVALPKFVKGECVDEMHFINSIQHQTNKPIVLIYTDGSYSHGGNGGGFGLVSIKNPTSVDYNGIDDLYETFGENIEVSFGGRSDNHKKEIVRRNFPALMELTAVVAAIKSVESSSHIHIATDNAAYVLSNIKNIDRIAKKEKARGFSEAAALWQEIKSTLKEKNHTLSIQHIYGHKGLIGNETADKLAKLGSKVLGTRIRPSFIKVKNTRQKINSKHSFVIDINEESPYQEQINLRLKNISKELEKSMESGFCKSSFHKDKNGKCKISFNISGEFKSHSGAKSLLRFSNMLLRIIKKYGIVDPSIKSQFFESIFQGMSCHLKLTNQHNSNVSKSVKIYKNPNIDNEPKVVNLQRSENTLRLREIEYSSTQIESPQPSL